MTRPDDTPQGEPNPPPDWRGSVVVALRRYEWTVPWLALGLILLRTSAFMFFEGTFNSDQAVTGLMTTHLVEGRAVPVFKYGQNYQLGVQAWAAAPLFALFGPSVFLLKLPLLVANLLLAALLVRLLRTELGLRPWMTLVVASPFLLAPPGTSIQLLEPSGGNVEPLLLVPILWLLRRHPLSFGAVLAVGFLQRVFSIYALGALLLVELADGSLFSAATLRRYLRSGLAFAAVWQAVALVRVWAGSDFGPATPAADPNVPLSGATASNAAEAVGRFCWDLALLPQRVSSLLGDHLAITFGGRHIAMTDLHEGLPGAQGVDGLWLVVGGVLLLTLGRLAWLVVRGGARPWHGRARFGLYLLLTGVLSGGAIVASRCGELDIPLRYSLHMVLAVTGLVGCYLASETVRGARRVVVTVLALWALTAAWGHGRLLAQYIEDPPRDPNRALAQYLVDNDIRYGFADYWDAYNTVFFADEQVIVTSTTVVFITEYESLAMQHLDEAVWIYREPCEGGTQVTEWHWVCNAD